MNCTNDLFTFPDRASTPMVTLATGAIHHRSLSRWRELAKLYLRGYWHGEATRGWLATINALPMMRALAWEQPRLVGKIHRPFLSNAFSLRDRLTALQSHYAFITRHHLDELVLTAASSGVELASITAASGVRYRVVLRAVTPMEREGELVLQLLSADELLYSSAFLFFHDGQRMVVGVGCMQGAKGESALARIRCATRDLHGLRPKNLMIKLLGMIGCHLGCGSMRLVGNDNRAVNRARQQGKVHADYNAFWRECGAVRRADGDFDLPCTLPAPPDLAAIKSSKRSSACRRHQTLHLLGCVVLSALRCSQQSIR